MDGMTHGLARSQSIGGDHQSASRMTEEMAAPAAGAAPGWKLESLNIRLAENGGVIVDCSKRRDLTGKAAEKANYEDRYSSKNYAFANAQDALSFIAAELQGEPASGGGSGAPVQSAARY